MATEYAIDSEVTTAFSLTSPAINLLRTRTRLDSECGSWQLLGKWLHSSKERISPFDHLCYPGPSMSLSGF
ncbi:hypothetical protein GCK32_019179 [Trichostrongylus colubriformis]|uniref:Uncharacterized protein n=1 Tax=Trichostrongylus colubriformis TaxID=6319 RepID=A0AAN8G023_TRICO